MNIDAATLRAQYVRAHADWPFITDTEIDHHLPPFLLYAIGSRETNLRNVVGDHGHGHGVFQLDDRFHTIPAGFDADVRQQAEKAAGMLQASLNAGRSIIETCNIYNSGQPLTSHTTGGDYGPDVEGRRQVLATGTTGHLHRTWGSGVRLHTQPSTASPVTRTLSGPIDIVVQCQQHAQRVEAEGFVNDAWSRLNDGTWISNIFVVGPAWLPDVPDCHA